MLGNFFTANDEGFLFLFPVFGHFLPILITGQADDSPERKGHLRVLYLPGRKENLAIFQAADGFGDNLITVL